ncbi:MAG: hypothetical protein AB1762_08630 [Gemmatimonadota bacterium]
MSAPPSPARSNAGADPVELLLDAELGVQSCAGPALERGVVGFARMKVRDGGAPPNASELEYELFIENAQRVKLGGATLLLNGIGSPGTSPSDHAVVLWSGETFDKQRLRMRGIVALPNGASAADVAAALRERRSALQVRVSDQSGSAAGCGDLRN